MAKRKRGKIQNYLEYYALRTAMFFIYLFPVSFARKIGQMFAAFAYYFIPVRKKHVIEMLSLSFPEKSSKEIKTIAKDVYKNFTKTVVDIMFFPKISAEKMKELMDYDNEELIDKIYKNGKGAIFLSAHFGNWELTALSFSQRYPVSVIVAKQSNPLVDKMIEDIRTNQGFKTINRDSMAYKGVLKALKRKEFVAILSDQDAGKQGIFIPFLGRLASVPKGPALFALRAKCPIITAFGVRDNNGKMTVKMQEIPLPDTGDEEENIRIILSEYNRRLEEVIRENPEQWFWFHRKWKTRPPEETQQ